MQIMWEELHGNLVIQTYLFYIFSLHLEVKLGDDENHGITFDFTVNVFIRHPKSKMIRVCI